MVQGEPTRPEHQETVLLRLNMYNNPCCFPLLPVTSHRMNKYDNELEEFWCDKRTSGRHGLSEREGLKESTSASGATDSLVIAGMKGNLEQSWERQTPGKCEIEAPKPAVPPH